MKGKLQFMSGLSDSIVLRIPADYSLIIASRRNYHHTVFAICLQTSSKILRMVSIAILLFH